jgi:hypothetical protein
MGWIYKNWPTWRDILFRQELLTDDGLRAFSVDESNGHQRACLSRMPSIPHREA